MDNEDRDIAEQAASATECTGLVPALTDETGEENTRRLCDVTAATRRRKKH